MVRLNFGAIKVAFSESVMRKHLTSSRLVQNALTNGEGWGGVVVKVVCGRVGRHRPK